MQRTVVDRMSLLLKRRNVEAEIMKKAMTRVLSALAPAAAIVVSNTTSQNDVAYFNTGGTFLRFNATTTNPTINSQIPQTRAELNQYLVCSSVFSEAT